ncbi:MAG: family 78 glycoside hydrolase catalytic domain [TACK group archaeon]|nr:family 78 glycoside hydrolase catalytic domain [TACK group archaeon]
MRVQGLLCEYAHEPLGVPKMGLRFSWAPESDQRGEIQSAYRIQVSEASPSEPFWDSGVVRSTSQIAVYGGPTLKPAQRYRWRVKCWDREGRESEWSAWSSFVTGLDEGDWKASWITGGQLMRKEFALQGQKVEYALAFVTGLGYYELHLNGKKVGDRILDPGWSDYSKRVLYSVHDVTDVLRGHNAVGVMLGHGRYLKEYGYDGVQKLLFQMLIAFEDGSSQVVVSDPSWSCSDGPITSDDIYDGECYDATREREGWDTPGYDDSSWEEARVSAGPGGKLVAETFPPIRVVGIEEPIAVSSPSRGVRVYDFGQNFTGWVRVRASAPRGTMMKIRYAELLDREGNLNVKNLGGALATDCYTFKGEGVEEYAPRFTYHGFRYAEISGLADAAVEEARVKREIVHTDVEVMGRFSSADGFLNSLHEAIVRGQLSNLMSIPTDCPQRKERMGWTGDAQLAAEEAMLNFLVPAFYENWLDEIEESQREDGEIPDVAPPFWKLYPADPAWGVAFLEIPWLLYVYFGDEKPIRDHYEGMKKYTEFLASRAVNGILKIRKYGDWCPPCHIVPPETPRELTDTWYLHRTLLLLSKMAGVLGKGQEERSYAEQAEKVAKAFKGAFFNGDHFGPEDGSQTCDALALAGGMCGEEQKAVASHLIRDVEVRHDGHLNTGIIGTRYLFDVLTDLGRGDLALEVATQRSYPGYGYMMAEGATTLWERWELLTGPGMNSHNHIMFGSVDSWLYRRVAGVRADEREPGFAHVVFKPEILSAKRASASLRTPRGLVQAEWWVEGETFRMKVTVPVGSRGTVYLQGTQATEGGKEIREGRDGITSVQETEGLTVLEVGSGSYDFSTTIGPGSGPGAEMGRGGGGNKVREADGHLWP